MKMLDGARVTGYATSMTNGHMYVGMVCIRVMLCMYVCPYCMHVCNVTYVIIRNRATTHLKPEPNRSTIYKRFGGSV